MPWLAGKWWFMKNRGKKIRYIIIVGIYQILLLVLFSGFCLGLAQQSFWEMTQLMQWHERNEPAVTRDETPSIIQVTNSAALAQRRRLRVLSSAWSCLKSSNEARHRVGENFALRGGLALCFASLAAAALHVSEESGPSKRHRVWLSAGICCHNTGGYIINASLVEEDGGLRYIPQSQLISALQMLPLLSSRWEGSVSS